MLYLEILSPDSQPRNVVLDGPRCRIGRAADADLVLPGWTVHKEHAEIFVSNEQAFVRDLGTMFGTYVKDAKVTTFGPLQADEPVRIGPHKLLVRWSRSQQDTAQPEETAQSPAGMAAARAEPSVQAQATVAGPGMQAQALPNPVAQAVQGLPPAADERFASSVQIDQQWLEYRRKIQDKLIESFDMRRTDVHRMSDAELRQHTEQAIREIFQQMPAGIPASVDRQRLMQEVRDEAIGLGLLEPLLADPSVTEIMVNRVDEIFVERAGRLSRVPLAFSSEKAVMGVIERIVAPVGRRIDESSPLVDARLKDGSRFNAIIPPLALKGPSMTIRKFSKRKLMASDLIKFGSANEQMVEFLRVAVEQHKNIIVSGGTGSGKTTLLNILSNFIPDGERIVTIEDAAELQLPHEHLVSLESRPANAEGKGQIAIRELVKNSLRMRPDRIVVGECRGGEALDMLQAMNTGHDGSLTTAHANSPRDMLARLEVMVMMAGMELPVTAIREQVASAVDLIVQQTRFACGSRKITRITEVTGVESGKIQLQDLFEFVETGFTAERKTAGFFTGCDCVPEFYEKLRQIGVQVSLDIFKKAA
ncbi:ATPase, T2SS/T4P/T4SS family [Comamonas composti]|uniref:ATPase, T2SS/T4P/T4SS family n=1 Tax=Comamonas composti TaxID=408558 RepID=UPI000410E834|nr:ATPase, T2SS/T4P/T4SS family [Comamonas composti]